MLQSGVNIWCGAVWGMSASERCQSLLWYGEGAPAVGTTVGKHAFYILRYCWCIITCVVGVAGSSLRSEERYRTYDM